MKAASRFPGFKYPASELLKYLAVSDFFTIFLKDGDIIHFTPENERSFLEWLEVNQISDVRKEKGWVVD